MKVLKPSIFRILDELNFYGIKHELGVIISFVCSLFFLIPFLDQLNKKGLLSPKNFMASLISNQSTNLFNA